MCRPSGFACVALVVDAYARRILGWRVASTIATSMVLDTIEQAIWSRQQEGVLDLKDVVTVRIEDHRVNSTGRRNTSSVEVSDGQA
jgi:transposase InsO family protein